MSTPQCLAIDFGGTLARPGVDPDGAMVADALATELIDTSVKQFATTFDRVRAEVEERDQRHRQQTPYAVVLAESARRCGGSLRDPMVAAELVFDTVGDAEVDSLAAQTLRHLHHIGWSCVLASNTQRPEAVRRRTLAKARIDVCFSALVLSSTIGVRKPFPPFYEAVIAAADAPAAQVLFVGDMAAKDVLGPRDHGMPAVLVATPRHPAPPDLPSRTPVISHFSELPAVLERWDER